MKQTSANEDGYFSSGYETRTDPRLGYLGPYQSAYAAYASDLAIRQKAASGGVATSLLKFALANDRVDGVALCRSQFAKGQIGYEFKIVTDPLEIPHFGSSSYFNIPLEKHRAELEAFAGRLAILSLPCHTSILRSYALKNVAYLFSLFCGHNNEADLIRFFLDKEGLKTDQIKSMKIERTYLGGSVKLGMLDETERRVHFRHFNVYRSLGLYAKAMCRYCDDHLGATSDISIGDIFTEEYRQKSIKHSAVLVRSDKGLELWQAACRDKSIVAHEIDPLKIYAAQQRILVPSRDLKSRYYACKINGFPVNRNMIQNTPFRLRSFITYACLLLNQRISRTAWGRRLFMSLPRTLLYVYIAILKIINHTLRPKP